MISTFHARLTIRNRYLSYFWAKLLTSYIPFSVSNASIELRYLLLLGNYFAGTLWILLFLLKKKFCFVFENFVKIQGDCPIYWPISRLSPIWRKNVIRWLENIQLFSTFNFLFTKISLKIDRLGGGDIIENRNLCHPYKFKLLSEHTSGQRNKVRVLFSLIIIIFCWFFMRRSTLL